MRLNPLTIRFRSFHPVYFICCLLASAAAESQLPKIYLQPKSAATLKQSTLIDSIKLIPLEVKEGIELNAYNGIEVTKDFFLLKDYINKRILVYTTTGKFKTVIHYKKLGPAFYPVYDEYNNRLVFFGTNKNYTLTAKDKLLITRDWKNPRNKKYFKKYSVDLADSSFRIQKDIPTQNDIVKAYPLYANYYWQGQILTSELYKDSLDYELKIYRDDQPVKNYFPYNRIDEPRFLFTEESVSLMRTDQPHTFFVTRPFCDTIYKMVNDSLFPAFQLVVPLENSLPPSFFSNPFKNKTERENFRRNYGWAMRQVYNIYETPRFFCFSVSYLSNNESYIYLKQTNSAYKVKNIKADSSQYNLPLLSDFGTIRKGEWFYKPQKSGELQSYFTKNSKARVPKELEEFLKTNPPASSPVVIQFNLKNQP